jgi:hypothetical protein
MMALAGKKRLTTTGKNEALPKCRRLRLGLAEGLRESFSLTDLA